MLHIALQVRQRSVAVESGNSVRSVEPNNNRRAHHPPTSNLLADTFTLIGSLRDQRNSVAHRTVNSVAADDVHLLRICLSPVRVYQVRESGARFRRLQTTDTSAISTSSNTTFRNVSFLYSTSSLSLVITAMKGFCCASQHNSARRPLGAHLRGWMLTPMRRR